MAAVHPEGLVKYRQMQPVRAMSTLQRMSLIQSQDAVTDNINPPNDYCGSYESLEINGPPVVGTAVDSARSTRSNDVFYGFVGNGRTVRVSSCFDKTTVAHNFLLCNGGCTSRGFGEVSTDASCKGNGNAAAYEFDTIAGRFYPIIVYSCTVADEGLFAIQVTDYINPPNDYCDSYQLLDIGGPSVMGSTVNSTRSTRSNNNVFYSFVGNGRTVRVSTFFEETLVAHSFLERNGGYSSRTFGEVSTDATCTASTIQSLCILKMQATRGLLRFKSSIQWNQRIWNAWMLTPFQSAARQYQLMSLLLPYKLTR
jgi:hypothetical protein